MSGLRTPAAVSRWLDRQGLQLADQEDTTRQVQAGVSRLLKLGRAADPRSFLGPRPVRR